MAAASPQTPSVYALEQAQNQYPSVDVASGLAVSYFALGFWHRGALVLQSYPQAGARYPHLLHRLALHALMDDRPEDAIAHLQSILDIPLQERIQSTLLLADLELHHGACASASAHFEELLSVQATQHNARLGLLECEAREGHLEHASARAEEAWDQLLLEASTPQQKQELLIVRGILAAARGDRDAAESIIDRLERSLSLHTPNTRSAIQDLEAYLRAEPGTVPRPSLYPATQPLLLEAVPAPHALLPETLAQSLAVDDARIPFEAGTVRRIEGDLILRQTLAQSSVYLPDLVEITGDLVISDNFSLVHVDLPALERVGGTLRVEESGRLPRLALPALIHLGGLQIEGLTSLQTVDLPRLRHLERLWIQGNPVLTTLDLGQVDIPQQPRLSNNPLLNLPASLVLGEKAR